MRSLVKILSILLLSTAPVLGQEAGDNVRALFKSPSSGVQLQLDSIFGVITPELQLETEDGTIIAKDALIDPEYFAVNRGGQTLLSFGAGVTLLAGVEALRTCGASSNDTSGGWMPIPDDISCPGYSWPLVGGVGSILGALFLLLPDNPDIDPGDWKPW